MFFTMLLVMFVMCGSLICMVDTFIPGFFIPMVAVMMRWTGVILIWTGVGIYLARSYQTGAALFTDLPNVRTVKLVHQGNSGARFLNSFKAELNTLVTKGSKPGSRMRIKDMGKGIRIAGHEVQFSTQTVGYTYPPQIIDVFSRWRKKYGIRNRDEFLKLYEQIKGIRSYVDLEHIDFLKPVMADPIRRKVLLDMKLDDLRNMSELLFDGSTMDVKSYLDWDEAANPYDNESIINRTLAHRAEQRTSYRFGSATDWAKIVIPASIILIMGAIAFQVFGG